MCYYNITACGGDFVGFYSNDSVFAFHKLLAGINIK